MEGPNGNFREYPGAKPLPPNTAKIQSTYQRHCTVDPRFYELKGLQNQAQMGLYSPGPIYNTRLEVSAPCTIFSPRAAGKVPRFTPRRDEQGKLMPQVYSAGGPRGLLTMRTRAKKKGLSSAHPATDRIFPSRALTREHQNTGFLTGHTSTFGKPKDAVENHAGVLSTLANGPSTCFAPPFDEVNETAHVFARTPRKQPQSSRIHKVTEIAGHIADEPPALAQRPRVEPWRANRLFPYSNAASA